MNDRYLKVIILSGILFSISMVNAQVYVEKQTRHRFAQLNLGVDYQTNFGGSTQFIDPNGELERLDLGSLHRPRFLIGGTHFWGHADIFIGIPLLRPRFKRMGQEISYLSGVETVFKYYPWRIENNKIRPFLGVSIAPFYYEQRNSNLENGNGPELNHTSLPFTGGITFNRKSSLLELGLTWNYGNEQRYYISKTDEINIKTPPLYLNFSYRIMLETTGSAERSWESGEAEKLTQKLAKEKKLDNFFIGGGLSSSFWIGNSSYNLQNRRYLERYSTSIMPDLSIGYYFNNADLNITGSFRPYSSSTSAYGTFQIVRRRSVGLEVTKYLFDYNGFVPFVGPLASYDRLFFGESLEGNTTHFIWENKIGYGLAFGWDIRPNRLQKWILRTSLRWYPDLSIQIRERQEISFNNIEFNFIQLIIYPGRFAKW
ncbi:MAG: hypothetical protein MRZ79_25385 [Bacteroidia bacterium]|nr:hypothetical protein [Bacteroidia bacterium]